MRLDLPDADVRLEPGWLEPGAADALFAALLGEVPWRCHPVRLFGREVPSPRLSCWMGDPGAAYRYSGVRHLPEPWRPALAPLRTRLAAELGVAFDSVLVNLYRDGADAMGWHADDEPELGPAPVIASVSLGATRRFALKHRASGARHHVELPHGSLLVMAGTTQQAYRHALPRTRRPVGARINLTFRRVAGEAARRAPRGGA
ncbi:alpha-ketoglutarate-dependent dioxygenase AlkB family protein [Lysobacter humi (ex Lee et al. 2017)]